MKAYQVCASIVVYENDPAEVVSAIRSFLSTALRVTCTVIDNSPTPALRDCVTESGAKYIHVGTNLGFGRAHNLAILSDSEHSEYHLVLNPDVSFVADVPSALYRFMNDHQDIGLVMPRVLYPNGTDQRLCKKLPSPFDLIGRRFLGTIGRALFAKRFRDYEMLDTPLEGAREVPCLSGCFMFLRRSALREVGCFDERYFMYMEDVDLCRRIGAKYKTVFYPDASVIHGYAKGSYRESKLLKNHLQSAIRYFMKWGWIYDLERRRLNQRTGSVVLEGSGEHS